MKEQERMPKKFVPNSNYKDKYAHLIGHDAALKAAKKTETNKNYGFGTSTELKLVWSWFWFLSVPSENKKDVRSIEQTMADIRAKKRLKTEGSATVHEAAQDADQD